ncbi:MAG: N-acetyl-gamma-glutamyl-phosphate reductase [Armatimonadetes bacterium]|nr:N-acetyl-gamma-glutamyl-phosphate reductase [Armatimonadota bacterium]
MDSIPVVVLGGTGYVAGETLRLLASHPMFAMSAVVSESASGQSVEEAFPHLCGMLGGAAFASFDQLEEIVSRHGRLGVVSALPHGASAEKIHAILEFAAAAGHEVKVVDLSTDFRFPPEGSPFFCGLPDLEQETPDKHIAEPGCFTTAATLATAPLVAGGWVVGDVVACGVTGSTGSGRTPKAGTHHPDRHSGMWAYEPVRHRHSREMKMLVSRHGSLDGFAFLPHSGPFARGIHMTVTARLAREASVDQLVEFLHQFFSHTPFVSVSAKLPSVKEVVGTNRCHIGIAVEDGRVVVTSVIDNLTKGAAGGGVQWLNRLFGLPQETGLLNLGVGWN